MNIGLVLYRYQEGGGGVEGHVAILARGLRARGHDVHLFAHTFEPAPPAEFRCHRVPALSFYSPWRDLSFARRAAALLEPRTDLDVIHGFGRTIYQDVYRVGSGCHWEYLKRTQRGMGHAWGRAFHRLNPRNAAILHLERLTFGPGGHRLIVCNSRTGKAEVQHYFGLPDDRVRVVYNSVDAQRFHPELRTRWREEYRARCGVGPGDLLGLFVGRGGERKGLDLAIEALARLQAEAPVRLAVLGMTSGPYLRLAERSRLPVFFLGYQKEVERFHAASDFFLLPTRYDAFANAGLEAMASGLPVAISRPSGVSEIIEDDHDGLILEDPEDAREVAGKIRILLDPARRDALGQAARAKAASFTEARLLDAIEGIYREIQEMKHDAPNIPSR